MSKSQTGLTRAYTDKKPDTQGSPIFLPEERVSCYVGDQTAKACFPSGEEASKADF